MSSALEEKLRETVPLLEEDLRTRDEELKVLPGLLLKRKVLVNAIASLKHLLEMEGKW